MYHHLVLLLRILSVQSVPLERNQLVPTAVVLIALPELATKHQELIVILALLDRTPPPMAFVQRARLFKIVQPYLAPQLSVTVHNHYQDML